MIPGRAEVLAAVLTLRTLTEGDAITPARLQ
jgi:hypothetical protein